MFFIDKTSRHRKLEGLFAVLLAETLLKVRVRYCAFPPLSAVMNHSSAVARSARGRGRGRGRVLGDTRRETVEAAAAKARLARRRAERNPDALASADDDDDDEPADAPKVAHDPDAPIFADMPYDDDDHEADKVYDAVEERMRSRRLKQTEAAVQRDLEIYRRANPSLPQQFSDLKRKLGDVSEAEWADLPDVGDRSIQKRRLEKYTPAPDSLLQSAIQTPAANAPVLPSGRPGSSPDDATNRSAGRRPASAVASTDLARIGEGRTSVMGHKLDTAGDSVTGQTNIDPSGYLTEMAGMHISSDSEVGDVRKARALLKSVTTTNPNHAPGWIAAARLEEVAGKLSAARVFIAEGCHYCPNQEDVWLEAARLHPETQAKTVLANAVKHVPKSVKIWLHATALEVEPRRKKRVLRKALEVIPGSAKLWRTAVDLEEPEGARILLSRAVECVPNDLNLWLGLAKLQSYESAKVVLNRALRYLRAEPAIWLTGAKLEETQSRPLQNTQHPSSSVSMEEVVNGPEISGSGVVSESKCPVPISRLVLRAVKTLSIDEEIVKRERWLEEARIAEDSGFPLTCKCIVDAALAVGIDAVDQKRVWLEDAAAAIALGRVVTARAIFSHIVVAFPGEQDVWQKFAVFEMQHGSADTVAGVLERAVEYCPRAEVLWLMAAKQKWKTVGVKEARELLERAKIANPDSENIFLAAAKIETEVGGIDRARGILKNARKITPSARVWMKCALLERKCRDINAESALLEEGVELYPTYPKLWLMLAQLHERREALASVNGSVALDSAKTIDGERIFGDSRNVYVQALKSCATNVPLWRGLASADVRFGKITKARATLERGRQACVDECDVDMLWWESVMIEMLASGKAAALSLLARGLKEQSDSGCLWGLAIALESRARQRARIVDALKHCDQNAVVLLEAGKFFWRGRKLEQARDWLTRSVRIDPSFGDTIATLYAFELADGSEEKCLAIEHQVASSSVKYGRLWTSRSKLPGNEEKDPVGILKEVASLVREDSTTQAFGGSGV